MMSQMDDAFDEMMDDGGMLMDLEDMLQDDDHAVRAPQMLMRTVTPETQYRKTSDAVTMALQGQTVNGQEQLITPRMASCMAMDLDLPDVAPGLDSNPGQHNDHLGQVASNGPCADIPLMGPTADLLKTPMIPEGKPLVPQVTLMDALPTPTLPAPSPAFMQQGATTTTSSPALSFDQMVAASTAASACLAPPLQTSAPEFPKHRRPHRRAATEGSFDFLYRQQQVEHKSSIQQKAATGEPLLGPMEPPKQDPLNVMAHSFLKQEQLRLVTGAPPPPPPPPPPSDQASAPAPTPFAAEPASAPNPFLQAEQQPREQQSIIALDGADDDDDHQCIQTNDTDETLEFKETATAEVSSEEAEAQPSRLSRFLDTLQAQADLHTQMLMDEHQQQRNSGNVHTRQFDHDYHQPPPTRQKRKHRRVVSDVGPSYHQQLFQQQPFDMSDMIEDRALWMK